MGRGSLCIEYDKNKNGETLSEPFVHELKTISVNENSKGTHFFNYIIDKKLYQIIFMQNGIAVYVVDDESATDAQARRIYATDLDEIDQQIDLINQSAFDTKDDHIKIMEETIKTMAGTIKTKDEIIRLLKEKIEDN